MSFLEDLERHRNDERTPVKDQVTSWAILTAVGAAGFTGKMILENMFHRSVGKYMSKLTIPVFIISTAVAVGYTVSDMIDPEHGINRFTDSLLDPVGSARTTTAIGVVLMQEHLTSPDLTTGGTPVFQPSRYDILNINRYLNYF